METIEELTGLNAWSLNIEATGEDKARVEIQGPQGRSKGIVYIPMKDLVKAVISESEKSVSTEEVKL